MLKSISVLYVEDDQETIEAFVNAFEDEFKSLTIAKDGLEGLSRYKEINPDLIITDLQMPRMSGLEMISQIRDADPSLPIIVNSAFTDTHLLLKSISLRVTEYVLKPTNPERLLDILKSVGQTIRLEQSLLESREIVQMIMDEIPDPILYILPDLTVEMMNKAARSFRPDWTSECRIKCFQLSHNSSEKCSGKEHPCPIDYVKKSAKPVTFRHTHMEENGTKHFVDVHTRPVFDDEGNIKAFIEITHDMTEYLIIQNELIEETKKLSHISMHDTLTQLPNRRLLADRIEQAIQLKSRTGGTLAVFYMDLDHFKEVNDSLGHHIGDSLLVQVSQRIQKIIRKGDTIARIGGDEFVLLIHNGGNTSHYEDVAKKIQRLFHEPFMIDEHKILSGCSIGISIFPQDGVNSEILLSNADAAMYASKNSGRHQFQFYTPEMTQNAYTYINLSHALQKAIKQQQFFLLFQPFFSPKNKMFTSAEALIRWQHPQQGVINPIEFLPVARKAGLMPVIDLWVLEKACEGFVQLVHEKRAHFKTFSINISVETLMQTGFVKKVETAIANYRIPFGAMVIEVIENQIMENVLEAKNIFQELHSLGVLIALDDFGTGYSSLSYLLDFEVDILKIDASFIRRIESDEKSTSLVKSILALSKTLSLTVVAEGIETEAQKDFLITEGIDFLQGYYHSLPITIDALSLLLDSQSNDKENL